jgi:hypothetical protein
MLLRRAAFAELYALPLGDELLRGHAHK